MRRLLTSLAAVGLVLGCVAEAPTEADLATPELSVAGASEDPGGGWVTVPFKADFYTEQLGDLVLDGCGPGVAINTQVGMGRATHLGRFTSWMVFCFDLTETPNFGKYSFIPGPENGYFTAANGDRLWITVEEGQVFFTDELGPDYVGWFQDPFLFTGGTGRFEGASGGGEINSLAGADGRTEHRWTGELTLMSGR